MKVWTWPTFWALWGAGMIGALGVMPQLLDIINTSIRSGKTNTSLPLWVIVLLALVQNGIILAIAVGVGLIASRRVGFQMPIIDYLLGQSESVNIRALLTPAVIWGLLAGTWVVLIESLVFVQRLPPEMQALAAGQMPLWKRLLSGVLYGGITEEILMRLFLLSLVVWGLGYIWQTPAGLLSPTAFWVANVIVAAVFAAFHLPITSTITPLTPLIIVRTFVLNGSLALIFGFLYWKYSLEAAMVAHMTAHLILQIPGVMIIRALLHR